MNSDARDQICNELRRDLVAYFVILLTLLGSVLYAQEASVLVAGIQIDQSVQDKIACDVDGVVEINLADYGSKVSGKHIYATPGLKKLWIYADPPVEFTALPYVKYNASTGLPFTPSLGVFHVQCNTMPIGWTLEEFKIGPGITFDGLAPFIRNPDSSDAVNGPAGRLRPLFYQITYDDRRIKRFELVGCKVKRWGATPIQVASIEDGLIADSSFQDVSRTCVGMTSMQGSTPYRMAFKNVSGTRISSPFNCSQAPGFTGERFEKPVFKVDGLLVTEQAWHSKIYDWSADLNGVQLRGDGGSSYGGIEIYGTRIGTVHLRNSSIENFSSHGLTWVHTSGLLILENLQLDTCRVDWVAQAGGVGPVELRGLNTYTDVGRGTVTPARLPTDQSFTRLTLDWNGRAKIAIERARNENIPPPTWWGMQTFMSDYARALGWNGSKWL